MYYIVTLIWFTCSHWPFQCIHSILVWQ